jgi:NADH:ubiquinone oxidoreductase subunit 4 (subunit M)
MVLAGLLLKLGGYGLVRVLPVISFSIRCVTPWVLAVSLFGGLASSLVCLRQVDSKSLVAYSSVAHMSLVVVGLFLIRESG